MAMALALRRFFERADAALYAVETAFIGAAIAAASLVLFVNVALRYVFLAPISWAEELSIYLVIWIVFIGAGVLIRTGGHITVDLLPRALSPALRRALHVVVMLLILCFLAVFIYYSGLHTLRVRASGQLTPIMLAPMWLTYLAMPVGGALMFLRSCQVLWRVMGAQPETPVTGGEMHD